MSVPRNAQEPRSRLRWLLAVVALCVLLPLHAAEPPATPRTDEQQVEQLKERDRLSAEVKKCRATGKLAEAITAVEKKLAIERQVFGNYHDDVAGSLEQLAEMREILEHFPAARKARQEILAIWIKRYGEKHWRTTKPRRNLDYTNLLPRLQPAERERLIEAEKGMEQALELKTRRQYTAAISLVKKAVEARTAILGDKHLRTGWAKGWLATLYHSVGDYAKAEQFYRQSLEINKQVLGEQHPDYATSLNNLAALYNHLGAYAKAEPLYLQARDIRKQVLGEKHPDYASSLNNLAALYDNRGDYAKAEPLYRQALAIRKEVLGEQHPDYATSLNNLAMLYRARGAYAKAEPLYRQARDIFKQVLGEKHPDYATSLNNLARLYDAMGDHARAEPLYLQARDIRKQVLGEKHPDYAASLHNLAGLYKEMGDYARAEPLYRQAHEICKRVLGEKHPDYALCLHNLAWLYREMGDYARAEPLYRQARDIRKQVLGEKHPAYAQSLSGLAYIYALMGDYAGAESVYCQARDIRKQVLGEKHPDYAESLNNLARLYDDMGDYAKAEPLYRQAHEIFKQVLGEKHPYYATSLNNLALLYSSMGAYAKAEPLYLQARDIRKQVLGEKHPLYAASLNNLAALYDNRGDYAKAESLYRQALEINKQVLDEQHPRYAASLNNLAFCYSRRGDNAKAELLYRQALKRTQQLLYLTANAQGERQQRAMSADLRYQLDNYLSCALNPHAADQLRDAAMVSSLYEHVLTWKGAVFARQRRLRLQRQQPELVGDFERLHQVVNRLATLAFATPKPPQREAWLRQIHDLTRDKEHLESDLARKSAAFQKQQQLRQLTPAQLQQTLPADTALIDFLIYTPFRPPTGKQDTDRRKPRLAAFVVRRESLRVLDLGPQKPVAEAIDQWRASFGQGRDGAEAGMQLRRLIWDRLANHLKGARTVLLSPDGVLARFPWAALPGEKPATYLIEERAVAVVAVPQQLPELLAPLASPPERPSLLLVGSVDFDAASGKPATQQVVRAAPRANRSGAALLWGPLPGTGREIDALKKSFQVRYPRATVAELRAEAATESTFRRMATRYRYLHLATHGFFAPPQVRSAWALFTDGKPALASTANHFGRRGLSGYHPQLLSGLVLAGANRPVERERDDGILTALEVAGLALEGVELVTLSACETGLGETAGGEGVLGLQRAFQAAGARTVAASLWKVPDQATALLMQRFYDNLWTKKLSKLESLRQAQLWLLREGRRQPELRRGLDLVRDEPAEAKAMRLPPYYWAAFVLSGDWR